MEMEALLYNVCLVRPKLEIAVTGSKLQQRIGHRLTSSKAAQTCTQSQLLKGTHTGTHMHAHTHTHGRVPHYKSQYTGIQHATQ